MPPLYTQTYIELNKQLHRKNPRYGANGGKNAPAVIELISVLNISSILDYGCGKGGLEEALENTLGGGVVEFQGYDPALTSINPQAADLVTCTDVMEHIEPGCIDSVLDHIFALCRVAAFFVISCEDGIKRLDNGQLAHCSVHQEAWWRKKLSGYGEVRRMENIEAGVHEAVFLVLV